MKPIKRLIRFISVNTLLAKYTLKSILLLLKILWSLRFVTWFNPRNWFRKKAAVKHESSQLSVSDFKPLLATLSKIFSTHHEGLLEAIKREFNKLNNKTSAAIRQNTEIAIEQNGEQHCLDVETKSNKVDDLGTHIKKIWNELNFSQFTSEEMVQQLGSLVNKGKELKKQVTDSLQLNITEFLQEELRTFPSRDELNDFFNDVDELSLSVGRLQAHINQIMSSHEIN